MVKIDALKIRPPKPTDLNFIQSTFLKSMKRESTLGAQCAGDLFFNEFQKVVDRILSRSKIVVACVSENEDSILGYLIFEPECIHYAYVRPSSRLLDIAKDMVHEAFPDAKSIKYSLTTNDSRQIQKKHPELVCNPFALYQRGAHAND